MNDPNLWYRDKDTLSIGGVIRYVVTYQREDKTVTDVFLRLKNIEKTTIRAIHMLNGPFILYCHVVPVNYDQRKKFVQKEREIHFKNSLKPGQTFNVKLPLNDNSSVQDSEHGDEFCWYIDVISQIVISKATTVLYDMTIGSNIESMKKLNHGPLATLTSLTGQSVNKYIKLNESFSPCLQVKKITGDELWSRPPTYDKPVHLIILTHGIFSNLTADMLYLKEMIETNVRDNVLVKGFSGNAGRTERGIKRMGSDQGKYLMKLIETLLSQGVNIDRISFIGHSLGGLTQLYSIKYILDNDHQFFTRNNIQPYNLVFMASPLLGILNEISFLLSWLLDLGTLGKTGRDLTLSKGKLKGKPLLEQLPDMLHSFMKQCKNLIIYANIINDGIVPLRTSGLLYLDYVTLDNVKDLKSSKETHGNDRTVGEIPAVKNNDKLHVLDKYKQFISLNFNWDVGDKKRRRLHDKILRINARGSDASFGVDEENDNSMAMSQDDAEETDLSSDNDEEIPNLNIPPKASVIESAINTLISPIPNQNYILNPESRHSPIFHDKFYKFTDLPPEKHERALFNREKRQVRIARKYHQELNWRKILVRLPPDAHNNIIVRRRFSNGYGWGVIDHLCELFNEENDTERVGTSRLEKIKSKI
ncbi:hypothetical protein PSN45_004940 [Yamadazyma tenuis]|uniref:DUF676-domain-containing protein n=1 Tax=Candida tenuis (strain ATCC 10573 / BCRC 21748 / CBS 615 / JCM 9827 / NBRC 10315 / NRRL Y-1498 / VKM Y-70) TaxID=590646 RepID=G3B278_CANTC|nr:DUF676-domain-containing protein [Yamadazyma tenuis ATCC 10573]EGV64612.1 DUF676-domain-containing protein [Yamadazyma tenuis ATCC 10573]WEJ97389.1 hypothetical protein PSN45_004940 [Yamadazyma tenuis]